MKNKDMIVKVHTFGETIRKAELSPAEAKSQQRSLDPFDELYVTSADSKLRIIEPPYIPLYLAKMREASNILDQCISAMVVNVEGFGYELRRVDDPTEGSEPPKEAEDEKAQIFEFFTYVNPTCDIVKLRSLLREDLESTGNAYMEIIRNAIGQIVELYWIPAHSMRLTAQDRDFTKWTQSIRAADGSIKTIQRNTKFRRFVQIVEPMGRKEVYFKEYGDPRKISSVNGLPSGEGSEANEVIHFRLPCNYSPYGLPRWAGQIMSILGARKAEEINFLFFDNKTIPPLIVLVSGGALTEEALDKLEDAFKGMRGVENFHRALVLEAVPHSASDIPGEKITPVRIEVKPLTEFIQDDATFKEYRKTVKGDVRSSFKLPPIYTGDTDDYTRATAMESARVSEEQVFEPERKKMDYVFNSILTDMKINYWRIQSLGAKTSDDVEIVKAIGMVKEAITVGHIMESVAEMRNVPVGKIPRELYTMTLSELMAKSSADARGANDGQGTNEDGDAGDPNQKKDVIDADKKNSVTRAALKKTVESTGLFKEVGFIDEGTSKYHT